MCNPSEESEDPDDSGERGRWTSYQKWSLAVAVTGVFLTLAIGVAQFYLPS